MKRHLALQKALIVVAERVQHLENWDESVHSALGVVGEAAGLSRIYMVRRCAISLRKDSADQMISEWAAPSVVPLSSTSEFRYIPPPGTRYVYCEKVLDDHSVYNLSSILSFPPGRSPFQYTDSIALIPININDASWGVIGFENSRGKEKWPEPLLKDFAVVANILAGSIRNKNLENILRRSRSRYRQVVDNHTDIICRYRADWTLTFANDAYCVCFGHPRRNILGRDMRGHLPTEFLERIEKHISLMDRQCPVLSMEQRLKLPDGEIRWFQWVDNAIFSQQGGITEYQGVGRDIHEKKIAELELKKAHDIFRHKLEQCMEKLNKSYCQLLQVEKMASLGLLVASIAHEINNPCNFISFNLPILRDYVKKITFLIDANPAMVDGDDLFGMSLPEFVEDLNRIIINIENGSDRINAVLSRLREFARPKGNEDIRPVNIRPVVEQALEICRFHVMEKVSTLEVNIPEDLPLITISPQIIEEIIINLLTNAAEAADKKNAWIRINVKLGKTDKEYFILEIQDNGHGLTRKDVILIFKPFQTSKEQEKGMGLGLYICKNLIESLGGRIEVESTLHEGSTFRLVVPKLEQGATITANHE